MKTIRFTQDVGAYPQGTREGSRLVNYTTGEQVEVNNEFADLMVEKGYATEVKTAAARTPKTDGEAE